MMRTMRNRTATGPIAAILCLALLGIGAPRTIDWTPVWLKELTLHGFYGFGMNDYSGRKVHDYAHTLELLAEGRLKLSTLVTHTFPLEKWRQAVKVCLNKKAHQAIKVAFVFP